MRRGFKAEAERLAARVRSEMGLPATSSMDVRKLAGHLGVEVIPADELVPLARLQQLQRIQPDAFSAATFRLQDGNIVATYNPLSEPGRTSSDIAHELAHLLLDHDVREIQRLAGHTFLTCDPEQEEEANWLAGCILLPRALLLKEAAAGRTAADIANRHTVSPTMARYRLNTSGVMLQLRRAKPRSRGA
jgi:Zn-dependent peptidase ImmA (M78 family)